MCLDILRNGLRTSGVPTQDIIVRADLSDYCNCINTRWPKHGKKIHTQSEALLIELPRKRYTTIDLSCLQLESVQNLNSASGNNACNDASNTRILLPAYIYYQKHRISSSARERANFDAHEVIRDVQQHQRVNKNVQRGIGALDNLGHFPQNANSIRRTAAQGFDC